MNIRNSEFQMFITWRFPGHIIKQWKIVVEILVDQGTEKNWHFSMKYIAWKAPSAGKIKLTRLKFDWVHTGCPKGSITAREQCYCATFNLAHKVYSSRKKYVYVISHNFCRNNPPFANNKNCDLWKFSI